MVKAGAVRSRDSPANADKVTLLYKVCPSNE